MDDVLDLGSVSTPEPDHGDEDPARRDHWLAELFRADVLAISGAALVVVTVLGTFAFGDFFLSSRSGQFDILSTELVYLPQVASGVLGSILGLAGLRRAVRDDCTGWVRAAAGAAAVVGFLLALGFFLVMLAADSAELFSPPQFG